MIQIKIYIECPEVLHVLYYRLNPAAQISLFWMAEKACYDYNGMTHKGSDMPR